MRNSDRISSKDNPLPARSFHKAVEDAMSRKRLSRYNSAADGNLECALRFYARNTAVSAAFYGPLQGLEITLRNAMDRQLAEIYGEEWYYNENAKFDLYACDRVVKTRKRLKRDGIPYEPAQMVANFSFGYWVSLTGSGSKRDMDSRTRSNYEMTLWRPALRNVFPFRKTLSRKEAHNRLAKLGNLRNRIAHHEPIIFPPRKLENDYNEILMLVRWMRPEMAKWIEQHSQVIEMLQTST